MHQLRFISLSDYSNDEFWNVLTHFIGLVLSLFGIPLLFYFNNGFTNLSIISIILFSIGLLLVYSSSTIYHFVIDQKLKKRFQI